MQKAIPINNNRIYRKKTVKGFWASFRGPLSLGILCFQGFGIRIFDGIIPGAIVVWAVLLCLINFRYLLKLKIKSWLVFGSLVALFLVFNLIKGIQPQFFIIVAWFSGFVVMSAYVKRRKKFVYDLAKLCRFCMYYSLLHIPIMLLFRNFFFHTNYNMEPDTFMYLFWFNQDEGLFGLPRIQGFAWEPSCWNLLLNLNLVFVLFFKKPIKDLILSVLAIISIMSTTGLMTMVAIFGLNWVLSFSKKDILRSLLLGSVFFYFIGPFVYDEFMKKMATTSGNTRLGDVAVAYSVILQSPLLGADLDNITNNSVAMFAREMAWNQEIGISRGYMENGMVNSFAALFVEWGVPLTLIILFLFFRNRLVLNKKLNVLLVSTVCLVLLGTPITRTGFFYLFVFSSLILSEGVNSKKYIRKKKRIVRPTMIPQPT